MLRVVIAALILGFTIYTLTDCVQTRDEEVQGLPKVAWVFVILLFPIVGGTGWLLAGRPQRPRGIQDRRPPRRPRGPDDDPDFLRGL